MNASAPYIDQLRHLMMDGHLRGALELLNMESGYRFTAIYRLGSTHAQNFMLVDRDNEPDSPFMADIPLDESYCQFVKALCAEVVIEDAAVDHRLSAHPYKDVVRAYCSMPLKGEDGAVVGTLCQFDAAPIESSEITLALMAEMARLLNTDDLLSTYRRAEIDQRVDRLSDMKDLISEASLDIESARSAFDSYALPLISEARQRLPMKEALEVEAQISAIWDGLQSGIRASAASISQTPSAVVSPGA